MIKKLLFWIKIKRDKAWDCSSFCETCPHYGVCKAEKDLIKGTG